MAMNQHLWNIALNLQSIQEIFYQFLSNYFFHTIRSTKHLVDQVPADYIGFYMQGSGKLDKYGFFFGACLSRFLMRLDMFFEVFHKI